MKEKTRSSSLKNALIGLGVCTLIVVLFVFGAFVRETPAQRQAATQLALHGVSRALLIYRSDCGAFPTQAEGLQPLLESPGCESWKGPYLKQADLLDEWDHPIQYQLIESTPRLISWGADGKEGGLEADKDHVLVVPQD